jgi:hypothetical protein
VTTLRRRVKHRKKDRVPKKLRRRVRSPKESHSKKSRSKKSHPNEVSRPKFRHGVSQRGVTMSDQAIRGAEAIRLEPWTESTMTRRRRVEDLWNRFLTLRPTGSVHLFARSLLAAGLSRKTATSYVGVLKVIKPQLTTPRKWTATMRGLRKLAATEKVRPARAATPEQMTEVLQRASPKIRATILLLWVSASRHADLKHAHIKGEWRMSDGSTVISVAFQAFKSDIFGRRAVTKQLRVSSSVASEIRQALRHKVSYALVLRAMKTGGLTVHSIRRGATSYLATKVPPEKIVLLTAHSTATSKETTALRAYLEESPLSTEGQTQQELSQLLVKAVESSLVVCRNHRGPEAL